MVKTKKTNSMKKVYFVAGIVIGLIALFLISGWIFRSMTRIEYEGLTFTKEKIDQIKIYHHYYFFRDKFGDLAKYNLFLRIDPRENDVPVNGEIDIKTTKPIFVSINETGIVQCPYSQVAIAGMSSFLRDNGLDVKAGSPESEQARIGKVDQVTCENRPDNYIILIEKGSETKIDVNEKCYKISVANCEVLEATEKFEVQTIVDARARERINANNTISGEIA